MNLLQPTALIREVLHALPKAHRLERGSLSELPTVPTIDDNRQPLGLIQRPQKQKKGGTKNENLDLFRLPCWGAPPTTTPLIHPETTFFPLETSDTVRNRSRTDRSALSTESGVLGPTKAATPTTPALTSLNVGYVAQHVKTTRRDYLGRQQRRRTKPKYDTTEHPPPPPPSLRGCP